MNKYNIGDKVKHKNGIGWIYFWELREEKYEYLISKTSFFEEIDLPSIYEHVKEEDIIGVIDE
jgi:hypothetical protein